MRITFKKWDRKVRPNWKNYVFQSFLATFVVFLIILALSVDNDAVIIASIGATAFIVFAMPKAVSSQPRHIIGGHLVGLISGLLVSMIPALDIMHETVLTSLIYAISVGSCIFMMVISNTEHPPAAGTALGVAINGASWEVVVTIGASAVLLALIHTLFKENLKD